MGTRTQRVGRGVEFETRIRGALTPFRTSQESIILALSAASYELDANKVT